jgi:hypothetical protein
MTMPALSWNDEELEELVALVRMAAALGNEPMLKEAVRLFQERCAERKARR